MLDFEHSFIAQICGRSLQPEDVKAVLDIVRPYLTDEQIFEINKDAQECFDNMRKDVEFEEDQLDENNCNYDWAKYLI